VRSASRHRVRLRVAVLRSELPLRTRTVLMSCTADPEIGMLPSPASPPCSLRRCREGPPRPTSHDAGAPLKHASQRARARRTVGLAPKERPSEGASRIARRAGHRSPRHIWMSVSRDGTNDRKPSWRHVAVNVVSPWGLTGDAAGCRPGSPRLRHVETEARSRPFRVRMTVGRRWEPEGSLALALGTCCRQTRRGYTASACGMTPMSHSRAWRRPRTRRDATTSRSLAVSSERGPSPPPSPPPPPSSCEESSTVRGAVGGRPAWSRLRRDKGSGRGDDHVCSRSHTDNLLGTQQGCHGAGRGGMGQFGLRVGRRRAPRLSRASWTRTAPPPPGQATATQEATSASSSSLFFTIHHSPLLVVIQHRHHHISSLCGAAGSSAAASANAHLAAAAPIIGPLTGAVVGAAATQRPQGLPPHPSRRCSRRSRPKYPVLEVGAAPVIRPPTGL